MWGQITYADFGSLPVLVVEVPSVDGIAAGTRNSTEEEYAIYRRSTDSQIRLREGKELHSLTVAWDAVEGKKPSTHIITPSAIHSIIPSSEEEVQELLAKTYDIKRHEIFTKTYMETKNV